MKNKKQKNQVHGFNKNTVRFKGTQKTAGLCKGNLIFYDESVDHTHTYSIYPHAREAVKR